MTLCGESEVNGVDTMVLRECTSKTKTNNRFNEICMKIIKFHF